MLNQDELLTAYQQLNEVRIEKEQLMLENKYLMKKINELIRKINLLEEKLASANVKPDFSQKYFLTANRQQ